MQSFSITFLYLSRSVSLSLAIVGMGEDRDSRDSIVESNTTNLGDTSLSSVGDDSNIVKTTFCQSILGRLSSSYLSNSPWVSISTSLTIVY